MAAHARWHPLGVLRAEAAECAGDLPIPRRDHHSQQPRRLPRLRHPSPPSLCVASRYSVWNGLETKGHKGKLLPSAQPHKRWIGPRGAFPSLYLFPPCATNTALGGCSPHLERPPTECRHPVGRRPEAIRLPNSPPPRTPSPSPLPSRSSRIWGFLRSPDAKRARCLGDRARAPPRPLPAKGPAPPGRGLASLCTARQRCGA